MKKLAEKIFFAILLGMIVLQITFIPQLFSCQIIPNAILSLLVVLALLGKTGSVFIIAFLAGLILDIVSGLSFGVITIGLILAVFTVSVLSSKFLLKSPEFFILALISFLGVTVYNLALFFLANINNFSAVSGEIGQIFFAVGLKIILELTLVLFFYKIALKLKD